MNQLAEYNKQENISIMHSPSVPPARLAVDIRSNPQQTVASISHKFPLILQEKEGPAIWITCKIIKHTRIIKHYVIPALPT
jgi:hypothetical protein